MSSFPSPSRTKLQLERIIAMGVIASLPPEEQEQARSCIQGMKHIVSKFPPEVALAAFLLFSCDFVDEAKKTS